MSLDKLQLPPWTGPILLWTLVQSVTGLTVAFTPARSPLRPIAATTTAVLAYLLQKTIRTGFKEDLRATGPVVAMCWVNVLNAIDLLVLSRASYEAQLTWEANARKNTTKDKHQRTGNDLLKRLKWSVEIAYNYRRINTPWQINRLPQSSTPVRSRTTFLFQSALKLCVSLLIIQLLTVEADDPHLARAIAELSESKRTLLLPSAGHPRRILTQALFTISFGIVTRCAIRAGYTLGAIISVSLSLSTPTAWPPIAGSLAEAWSLRRFWGITWHQLLRKLLTSNADFLASLCGVQPSSKQAYRFRLVFCFLVSGAIHSLMDMAFGVSWARTGGMWFFALHLAGCILESYVEPFLGSVLGLGVSTKRGVGYVWVCLYLLWVTPVWINPILLSLYRDGQRIPGPFFHLGFWGGEIPDMG